MTRSGAVLLLLTLLTVTACGKPPARAAPPADALVITADSSYWVTSDRRGLRMRGEPILITRLDGRFRELFVADDDRSFRDAVFVGQRMFLRDLVRGDSAELFADSIVPRLAREYAAAHPRESPISSDEEANEKPGTTATAALEILDVHPPFLSFEYHSDVETDRAHGGAERHMARRGVLDLRTGKAVSMETLFGREAAERAIAEGQAEWDAARDSILARRGDGAERAQRMLGAVAFDAASFSLDAHERAPEVVFAVPALARSGSTPPLELTARPVATPPWWAAQRDELPTGPDSVKSWHHGTAELVALTGDDPDRAKLVLRDAAHHEWPLGSVTAPVQRVLWLDASVTPATRRALRRAFNESSQNSEDTRIAAMRRSHPSFLNASRQTPKPQRRTPLAAHAVSAPHSRRKPIFRTSL